MVDIAIGQQNRLQWRMAQRLRVESRTILELLPDVGRGIQDAPPLSIQRHRQRRLARGRYFTSAGQVAIRAAAVPLRQAATGCRAQN